MQLGSERAMYADDPRVRWPAAREARRLSEWSPVNIRGRYAWWPRYWFGTVSAWLLFLGPSPGNSPGGPINWERDQFPTVGAPNEHFQRYEDGSGFWSSLRAWTIAGFELAEIFENDHAAALGMAMCGNVVETFAGDARKIPTPELERGMPAAARCIALVRPRLIVPMEKRLTPLLLSQLTAEGWQTVGSGATSVPAKSQRYTHYTPAWFDLGRNAERVLVAGSPQHPSRKNFYEPIEMDAYLASMLRKTLV